MLDLENQGDRAGAQTASLDPEREWTDRAALARAVAGSRSREEALDMVRRAPGRPRPFWKYQDEQVAPVNLEALELYGQPANGQVR